MSEERELIYPLDEKLWLVQISALEETDPSYKCTCRLTSAALLSSAKILKENWEIAYLNHSIAYEAVKDNELFAISKASEISGNFARLIFLSFLPRIRIPFTT